MIVLIMLVTMMVFLSACRQQVVAAETEENSDASDLLDQEYRFGYLAFDMNYPYFQALGQALELFLEEYEVQLLTKDSQRDAQLQNEQIQELIELNVDAVFLAPVDWMTITPALEALAGAEIPVIILENQVQQTDLVDAFIGTDNQLAGRLCGRDLVSQKPDGGRIVILEYSGVSAINERITGFELEIAGEGFEVVARIGIQTGRAEAQEVVKRILAEYDSIDAIMAGSDEVALGALAAAMELGRTEMLIYGVDGSPEMKQELIREGTLIAGTAARSPIATAESSVAVAMAILAEERHEEEVILDTFLLDRRNIELFGVDGWQ